ncbi:ORF89 [Ranid herpesvirus 1]|uniref:ORF89 n=1 Tax=Ranid herpesvirus 1 TaxID=85655 RepID=Q9YQX8_9VIRU|nr:ORF89 [Ranid herpesvirus 1]AAD12287.2 ORF89 [Ranid herpesvirus 1]
MDQTPRYSTPPASLEGEMLPLCCAATGMELAYLYGSATPMNQRTASRLLACATVANLRGAYVDDIVERIASRAPHGLYTPFVTAWSLAAQGDENGALHTLLAQDAYILYAPKLDDVLDRIIECTSSVYTAEVRSALERITRHALPGALVQRTADVLPDFAARAVAALYAQLYNNDADTNDRTTEQFLHAIGTATTPQCQGELRNQWKTWQHDAFQEGYGLFRGTTWISLLTGQCDISAHQVRWLNRDWSNRPMRRSDRRQSLAKALQSGNEHAVRTVSRAWLQEADDENVNASSSASFILPPECYIRCALRCGPHTATRLRYVRFLDAGLSAEDMLDWTPTPVRDRVFLRDTDKGEWYRSAYTLFTLEPELFLATGYLNPELYDLYLNASSVPVPIQLGSNPKQIQCIKHGILSHVVACTINEAYDHKLPSDTDVIAMVEDAASAFGLDARNTDQIAVIGALAHFLRVNVALHNVHKSPPDDTWPVVGPCNPAFPALYISYSVLGDCYTCLLQIRGALQRFTRTHAPPMPAPTRALLCNYTAAGPSPVTDLSGPSALEPPQPLTRTYELDVHSEADSELWTSSGSASLPFPAEHSENDSFDVEQYVYIAPCEESDALLLAPESPTSSTTEPSTGLVGTTNLHPHSIPKSSPPARQTASCTECTANAQLMMQQSITIDDLTNRLQKLRHTLRDSQEEMRELLEARAVHPNPGAAHITNASQQTPHVQTANASQQTELHEQVPVHDNGVLREQVAEQENTIAGLKQQYDHTIVEIARVRAHCKAAEDKLNAERRAHIRAVTEMRAQFKDKHADAQRLLESIRKDSSVLLIKERQRLQEEADKRVADITAALSSARADAQQCSVQLSTLRTKLHKVMQSHKVVRDGMVAQIDSLTDQRDRAVRYRAALERDHADLERVTAERTRLLAVGAHETARAAIAARRTLDDINTNYVDLHKEIDRHWTERFGQYFNQHNIRQYLAYSLADILDETEALQRAFNLETRQDAMPEFGAVLGAACRSFVRMRTEYVLMKREFADLLRRGDRADICSDVHTHFLNHLPHLATQMCAADRFKLSAAARVSNLSLHISD